ncbi:dihydroxy-acid dehydratase [Mesobacillus foraminis]|uniref:Dihydroxy-acid dehydratase n=1 Tax=Mesobacillus foraminis TaxID=279826 RepID=A0A4R2B0D9_9BACI|nr:dihydroxy-acid dehydratase [Mesobacillus foraminis]TCN19716.1 dihydroxy-acid dehydratase [Mesobacillus foraminis]
MLRSNLKPGSTSWAVRRTQWKFLGLSEEDFERPKIAVINTSSTLSSCYIHLDDISEKVQEGIRRAGGVPFEIRTTAPSDFITNAGREGRYILPSRDLIVNDIEVMVEGALLDGMICLSSCDKTAPAHMMAGARLNIPTIIVPCGYNKGGMCGKAFVDIDDVFESVGKISKGDLSVDQLTDMTNVGITTPGVCAGMGTANTMHILAEALGMTLPGIAPIAANSPKLYEFIERSSRRIVEMIHEELTPRRILTVEAFENAVRVALAIGGSVNSLRHLSAVAAEAELDVNIVQVFERIVEESSLLVNVRPNGPDHIEDLEQAGGAMGVMKQLEDKINQGILTVSGRTVGENLQELKEVDEKIIRSSNDPWRKTSGLVILRGNLAPEGAISKASSAPEDKQFFEGTAKVFNSGTKAIEALEQGAIQPGDVVVIREAGPKGGPGTLLTASHFIASLTGAGMNEEVAVITDGQNSGLNRGILVSQIMPEAAEGGPLAVVKEGDAIQIDLINKKINVLISDEELQNRLEEWVPTEKEVPRGWLKIYQKVVQSGNKGSILLE